METVLGLGVRGTVRLRVVLLDDLRRDNAFKLVDTRMVKLLEDVNFSKESAGALFTVEHFFKPFACIVTGGLAMVDLHNFSIGPSA